MPEKERVVVLLLGELSVNCAWRKVSFKLPRQRRVVLLLGELASELMPTRVVLSLGEFTMNSYLEAVTRPVTHARKERFPT